MNSDISELKLKNLTEEIEELKGRILALELKNRSIEAKFQIDEIWDKRKEMGR